MANACLTPSFPTSESSQRPPNRGLPPAFQPNPAFQQMPGFNVGPWAGRGSILSRIQDVCSLYCYKKSISLILNLFPKTIPLLKLKLLLHHFLKTGIVLRNQL